MKLQEKSNTNLNEMIQKIKLEGIQEAEKRAEEIIKEAETKASKIIHKARSDAEAIVKHAENEIKRKEDASKVALEQAARNIILSVRASLTEIFTTLVKKECQTVLSGETLKTLIFKVVEGWQIEKNGDICLEVLLSETDRDTLHEVFLTRLNEEIRSGIELKVHKNIEKGFRVGVRGEHSYFDFTDEGIADALAAYLNPKFYNFIDSLRNGVQTQ